RRSQKARQIVVSVFDPRPATALAAAVVVNGDEKPAPRRDRQLRVLQRLPHPSGVMQHSPGIDDVEMPEPGEVISVERRAFFDNPLSVAREIAPSQLYGADDRLRVVIERNHARPQSPGRQTEQPAARPDDQKTQSRERINLQHSFERRFGCEDLLIPNAFQKADPVLAELETFAASDLFGAAAGRVVVDSLVHVLSSKNPWARIVWERGESSFKRSLIEAKRAGSEARAGAKSTTMKLLLLGESLAQYAPFHLLRNGQSHQCQKRRRYVQVIGLGNATAPADAGAVQNHHPLRIVAAGFDQAGPVDQIRVEEGVVRFAMREDATRIFRRLSIKLQVDR